MSKILAHSKNGSMLKIGTGDKDYKWYFLDEKVKEFAAKIVNGTEVEFKSEDIGGEETINFITSPTLQKSESAVTKTSTVSKTGFVCKNCGASLKDDKYETCYTCSMEARKKVDASPEGQAKQTSIERQAVLKASANAVAIAMQGQVTDINTLGDMITTLFDKLYAKLGE